MTKATRKAAADYADFGPAIDKATMVKMEEASTSSARGQQRRLMLASLASSAEDLSRLSAENAKAFGEMMECVEAYVEHARGVLEISESALLRLQIADCRGGAHG